MLLNPTSVSMKASIQDVKLWPAWIRWSLSILGVLLIIAEIRDFILICGRWLTSFSSTYHSWREIYVSDLRNILCFSAQSTVIVLDDLFGTDCSFSNYRISKAFLLLDISYWSTCALCRSDGYFFYLHTWRGSCASHITWIDDTHQRFFRQSTLKPLVH